MALCRGRRDLAQNLITSGLMGFEPTTFCMASAVTDCGGFRPFGISPASWPFPPARARRRFRLFADALLTRC